MILIMKILLHNEYKIINWWYPTYVYKFFNFPYNYKNRLLACFQTSPVCLTVDKNSYRRQKIVFSVIAFNFYRIC